MSSSTIRKAIGAVKDQTSISIAKVAGNVAPDLEVLVVKATTHDNEPADDKYIREISNMVSYSQGYVYACIFAISKRLSKTRDWIVALKTLMLVHRLLIEGDPSLGQELMVASRKGTRILNMSGFRDEAHSSSWDHSAFVKAYALYLDQKLEFMVYEKKLGIITGIDKNRNCDMFAELIVKSGYKSNRRTRSFEELSMAEVHRQINDLGPERVMGRLNQLLLLLEHFLATRPAGAAQNTRMVLIALHLLVRDSFKLYGDISEMLKSLVEHFSELDYACCVKAFDAYVNAARAMDELVRFYGWCKDVGITRSSEFPEVEKISNRLLGTLERLLREKGNKPKRGSELREEITLEEVGEEKEEGVFDIKALPPPESIPQPQDEPLNPVLTEDLVNFKDDDSVSADVQGNKLALSLFSTTDKSTNVTSAWDHPSAEPGKPNWELALIDSVSQLSNQKTDLGRGFNPLVLDGMYDQGAFTQYVNDSQLGSGSASSVAAGKTTKGQVPALPAPHGTLQQDPFAASLLVPPPAYVQIADMQRKQQLLTQEQQLWQQYAESGMQGQLGLSGGSTYCPTSAQFIPLPHRMP